LVDSYEMHTAIPFIAPYLTIEELVSSQGVCKSWKAALSHPIVWKNRVWRVMPMKDNDADDVYYQSVVKVIV
jgi:hypothetical protein